MGVLESSGCVTFGDYFCACLEEKVVWNQMCVSEIMEETKHIPTLPRDQISLQKPGDPQSWSIPWAGLGHHGKSSQLCYFLLTLLSASLLSSYHTFCLECSSLIFSAWQTPTQWLKTRLLCHSSEALVNSSTRVGSPVHPQLCSYSATQLYKKQGREKEGSQI